MVTFTLWMLPPYGHMSVVTVTEILVSSVEACACGLCTLTAAKIPTARVATARARASQECALRFMNPPQVGLSPAMAGWITSGGGKVSHQASLRKPINRRRDAVSLAQQMLLQVAGRYIGQLTDILKDACVS